VKVEIMSYTEIWLCVLSKLACMQVLRPIHTERVYVSHATRVDGRIDGRRRARCEWAFNLTRRRSHTNLSETAIYRRQF